MIKIIRNYFLLIIGLLIMAFGVAFSIKADLGTSPITSLPYVVSLIVSLTVGQATIIMHCAFIFIQILLLRKQYDPIQLLQLPVAFIFGYMIDFAMWCIGSLECISYLLQWIYCVIGIILVGVGVSFEVLAGVVMLAGEGLVVAVTKVTDWRFGYTKISFDVSLVLIAGILSVVFLNKLAGIREGTIAAALFVGCVAKTINKRIFHIQS